MSMCVQTVASERKCSQHCNTRKQGNRFILKVDDSAYQDRQDKSLSQIGSSLPQDSQLSLPYTHTSPSLLSQQALSLGGLTETPVVLVSQLSLPYTHTSPSLLSQQALSLGGLTETPVVLVLQTSSYPYRTLTRLPLSCLYKRYLGGLTGKSVVLVLLINVLLMLEQFPIHS
ncbi:hypothetical protein J6590_090571 [Homalodisca vitripennis]|nr:hypothetical protein J6590_090571 [Homalodisca vitripennis]